MKEKTTKKRYMAYRYTNLEALEEYLVSEEASGWRLTSARGLLTFVRGEPRNVRYSVELLDSVSMFGNNIPPAANEYIFACEKAGWHFVCNTGRMYIFRTDDPSVPALPREPVARLKSINAATRQSYGLMFVTFILLSFSNLTNILSGNPTSFFTSYFELILIGIYLIYTASIIYILAEYLVWYVRARASVKKYGRLPASGLSKHKKNRIYIYIPLILTVAILITGIIFAFIKGEMYTAVIILLMLIFPFMIIALAFRLHRKNFTASKIVLYAILIGICSCVVLIVVTVTVYFLIPHKKPADNTSPEYNKSGFLIPCDNLIPVTLYSFECTEEIITNKVNASDTIFAAGYTYLSKTGTKRLEYSLYSSGFNFLVDMYTEDTAAGEIPTRGELKKSIQKFTEHL